MLYKTQGLVINFIRYRETSVIARVYTRLFGLRSYVVNGVRSGTNAKNNKIALFQPLSLLEMVVYNKTGEHLNRIAESRLAYPFQKLPFDIRRSSTGLFIAEILSKVLTEEKEDPALFDFLYQTVADLDSVEEGLLNFPLLFLIKLAETLGISVEDTSELASQLHLHGIYFDNELKILIERLLHTNYRNDIKLHKKVRAKAIDTLIAYFALHFENFGKVQSVKIFREL